MTETSGFWNSTNIGDGAAAGSSRDVIAEWVRTAFSRRNRGGVLRRVLNELAVSGSASPLSVATGCALVDGLYYENTAPLSLAVASPAGGTTGGRVILRASWAAQTVRALAIKNTDGNPAPPALTQVSGTTFEISLATFTITTGGVITLTDARAYATFASSYRANDFTLPGLTVLAKAAAGAGAGGALTALTDHLVLMRVGSNLVWGILPTASFANGAITNAKLRASAALSILGRAANSSGDPADIPAAVDGALARSGSALSFMTLPAGWFSGVTVNNSQLANGAVDDTKAGNRIVQLRKYQSSNGLNNTVNGVVPVQAGVYHVYRTWDTHASNELYLPEPVTGYPIMLASLSGNVHAPYSIYIDVVYPYSRYYFDIVFRGAFHEIDCDLHWVLIEMR